MAVCDVLGTFRPKALVFVAFCALSNSTGTAQNTALIFIVFPIFYDIFF